MPNPLTIEDVCAEIKEEQNDEYARGQSWEYCYVYFRDYKRFRDDEKLRDWAALHLGFFLASWGMLRGSGFLLQLNYKSYIPVVGVLIDQEHDDLWNVDCWDAQKQGENLEQLFDLKEKLQEVMKASNSFNQEKPTDTVITKIIMATMGCVPAYDSYFRIGLKKFFGENGNFDKSSFERLLKFSRQDSLSEIYKKLIPTKMNAGVKYPPMKLLDLYIWRVGGGKPWPSPPHPSM